MKKNDFIYPAIFLVIMLFLFVVPISAFLTSEVLGSESAKTVWCDFYTLLKDHGSFIAGVLGFGGVFIMINHQNTNTDKIIKEEYSKTRRDELHKNKEKASEQLYLLNRNFSARRQIGILLKHGENIITEDNFSRDYFASVFKDLHYLNAYLNRCDGTAHLIQITDAAASLFRMIQEVLYYEDHGDEDVFWVYGYTLNENLKDLKKLIDIKRRENLPLGMTFSVKANEASYTLQDIINGISSHKDIETITELKLYLGCCFIWIKAIFELGFSDHIKRIEFHPD